MAETQESRSMEEIAGDLRPLMQRAVSEGNELDDDEIVRKLAELIREADTEDESGVPFLLIELYDVASSAGYSDERLNLNMLFAVDSLRQVRTPEPGAQLRRLEDIAADLRPLIVRTVDEGDQFDQDEIVRELVRLIPESDIGGISYVPDLLIELEAIASEVGYTATMLDELHLNMVFALDALRRGPTEDNSIVADAQAKVASAMEQES